MIYINPESQKKVYKIIKNNKLKVILASASERRKSILEKIKIPFTIFPSDIEEKINLSLNPSQIATELSIQKAKNVYEKLKNENLKNTLILGSDTLVSLKDKILGKPKDEEDAFYMLWNLSRNKHKVITGISLIIGETGKILYKAEETIVYMKEMTEKEIKDYIKKGEGMGKAGAYALQETADKYVKKIEGAWDNVVGLCVNSLAELLEKYYND